MSDVQMLFPMEPKEFWRQFKAMVEQKNGSIAKQTSIENSPPKRLLKAKAKPVYKPESTKWYTAVSSNG